MNSAPIDDVRTKDLALLAISGASRSDSFPESEFKLFIIKKILKQFKHDQKITEEEIIIAFEDFPCGYSDPHILNLVLSTGLIEKIDSENYRIKDFIDMKELFPHTSTDSIFKIPTCNLKRLIKELEEKEKQESSVVSLNDCIKALEKAAVFGLEISKTSLKNNFISIPVFWNCQSDGTHTGFGEIPGTFATQDTLLLLIESAKYDYLLTSVKLNEIIKIIDRLTSLIINQQTSHDLRNSGGFFIGKDDDFPGSDFPTVDSTANGIYTLCVVKKFWASQSSKQKNLFKENLLTDKILYGIHFLLEMQHEDGSWGIYRYSDESIRVPPRAYSIQVTLTALAAAVFIEDSKEKERIVSSIDRCLRFLNVNAKREDEQIYWTADLMSNGPSSIDSIYTNARIVQGLINIFLAYPQFHIEIMELLEPAIRYMIKRWKPDPKAQALMEFRLPTNDGPSRTFMKWEPPADPIIVSALLQYAVTCNVSFDNDCSQKLNSVISHFISSQVHGHWGDMQLKKAFPSNTHYYCRSILDYIFYQEKQLNRIRKNNIL
jgi:hypothetical protein